MDDLPPNHHGDYRQFSGAFGYLAGLTMIAGRGSDAELVVELTSLTSDDRALDVGCGPGTAVRRAARRGADVIGVDPSAPMLRLAALITRLRQPSGTTDWVEAGAEDLAALDDRSIDACWSIASVHHWPDLEGGIAEVERVVALGGRFVALEKRTEPGATGNASHGWTRQQADTFAAMLGERGFASAEVSEYEIGRRRTVAVVAIR